MATPVLGPTLALIPALLPALILAMSASLSACTGVTNPAMPGMTAPLAERMRLERWSALHVPGQHVCRRVQVGLATHDWMVGVVTSPADAPLQVRIIERGRFADERTPSALSGPVTDKASNPGEGNAVSNPDDWQPCAGAHPEGAEQFATKPRA